MPNTYFQFKQLTIQQSRCAMKVTTDGCLFGAWCALQIQKIKPQHVLDIGAGSGLLSLMIAQKNLTGITAVEIDEDAAAQCGENIASSPWAEKIVVVAKDILTTDFASSFDIIVSNPPFYQNELPSAKETKNVAHHGRSLTLNQLFSFVQKNLSPSGIFFVLLPYKRMAEIEQLLEKQQLYMTQRVVVSPTTQHKPFRVMLSLSKQLAENRETKFAVKDDQGNYTAEFILLLKDYYL